MLFFKVLTQCYDPDILKVILYVRLILKIVFIGVPIVLIVMLTFDLVRNVLAGTEDTMKKNQKVAIKRIIYSVALFLVYPIVNVIFGLPGIDEFSYITCWNNAESIEKINLFTKTATLDSNGGAIVGDSEVYCGGEKSCIVNNLPKAKKKGMTFNGWGNSSDCTSGQKENITLTQKESTLYACWSSDSGQDTADEESNVHKGSSGTLHGGGGTGF